MNWRWAVAIGVLILGAGMFFRPHTAPSEPVATSARSAPPASADGAHPLYRWRNEAGVLQLTDTPPTDRPYERVQVPDDQNVVSLPKTAEDKRGE